LPATNNIDYIVIVTYDNMNTYNYNCENGRKQTSMNSRHDNFLGIITSGYGQKRYLPISFNISYKGTKPAKKITLRALRLCGIHFVYLLLYEIQSCYLRTAPYVLPFKAMHPYTGRHS
jgi:hypothetical protein